MLQRVRLAMGDSAFYAALQDYYKQFKFKRNHDKGGFAGSKPLIRSGVWSLSASPFYVGQVRTTCIPTLIQGGHADNALPQSVVATVNCRIKRLVF